MALNSEDTRHSHKKGVKHLKKMQIKRVEKEERYCPGEIGRDTIIMFLIFWPQYGDCMEAAASMGFGTQSSPSSLSNHGEALVSSLLFSEPHLNSLQEKYGNFRTYMKKINIS